MEKVYEIKVKRTDEGVEFSWDDDSPICSVDIDKKGKIMVCVNDGADTNFDYRLTGDVEYARELFKCSD